MNPSIEFSFLRFHAAYERFCEHVRSQQNGEVFRSFQSGWVQKQEGYKSAVRDLAIQRLNAEAWKIEQVGTGEILRAVIAAIEVGNGSNEPWNNLVQWQAGKWGPDKCSHVAAKNALEDTKLRSRWEALLFDFFRDELTPEEAMDEINQLTRRYDFVAYLFFLKDWEHFLPIATNYFDAAFEQLGVTWNGVPLTMAGKCSWENYSAYNAAIGAIRDVLLGEGIDEVRLLDAHSFCWVLSRIPKPEVEQYSPPQPVWIKVQPSTELPPPDTRNRERTPSENPIDFERLGRERRLLGTMAEEIILSAERQRLHDEGLGELAEKVTWVANDHTLGYDIRSWTDATTPRYIEVKAVRTEADVFSFYLSENEWLKCQHHCPNYYFYLVSDVRSKAPKIRILDGAKLSREALRPIVHFARLSLVPT